MSLDATIAFLEGYAERNGMVYYTTFYDGDFVALMTRMGDTIPLHLAIGLNTMQAARRLETKLREIGDVK